MLLPWTADIPRHSTFWLAVLQYVKKSLLAVLLHREHRNLLAHNRSRRRHVCPSYYLLYLLQGALLPRFVSFPAFFRFHLFPLRRTAHKFEEMQMLETYPP